MRTRPLPARPAGESDSAAGTLDITFNRGVSRKLKNPLHLPCKAAGVAYIQIRNPRVNNDRAEIPNQQRSASTLTEVLVAMMIASIGLASVATLFPMSALRAIKAAQFTSAADARYNAEAIIDLFPTIVSNPVYLPYPLNLVPPQNPTAAQQAALFWDPPLNSPQNYIVDPLGFALVQNLNTTVGNNFNPIYLNRPEHFFGNDPIMNQPWQLLPRYALAWRSPPVFINGNIPVPIVGGQPFNQLVSTTPPPGTPPSFQGSVPVADVVVKSPDSWMLQLSATCVAGTNVTDPGYKGPPNIGATEIDVPGVAALVQTGGLSVGGTNPSVRIVIFSADGQASQARNVTFFPGIVANPPPPTTANTVMWTEDVNSNGKLDPGEDLNNNRNLDQHPLPLGFVPGIVRIEQQDRRYTWLLTVRQSAAGLANIDVVVFFNRSFDSINDDELLYVTPAPLVPNSGQTVWGFTAGNNQVSVGYVVGGPKPFMRRGGFIFDANNAMWYRISNVNDPGSGTATITLDVPAIVSGPAAGGLGRAMFPRGVVDVFPIGSKSF